MAVPGGTPSRVTFDRHPDSYRHWSLAIDGSVATLTMNVDEHGSLTGKTELVLNSYDLGVDIELADAIQRLRFEHPGVRSLVITSGQERIFCAGANIRVLAGSTHAFKVNFCKYTNETRLFLEDASNVSGIRSLAALNGTASGGGYELALACDRVLLVDDRSSAVSLPEVPLLGVLPGTGGLTRVVDKRRVRRDLADCFSTLAEGVKGKKAIQWKLVDAIAPLSRFEDAVTEEANALSAQAHPLGISLPSEGVSLSPVICTESEDGFSYSQVDVLLDADGRQATLTVRLPEEAGTEDPEAIRRLGADWWPFRLFRELDDAILRLRFNHSALGTWLLQTRGAVETALAMDGILESQADDWFIHEVRHFIKRVLKRLELSARSLFALADEGSCFAGTFFELALACDRIYMLDDPDANVSIALSAMNAGPYPMSNGLTRLQTRFLEDDEALAAALGTCGAALETPDADDLGLVTDAPDDLDWEDTIRISIEERASLSPDALTGMEANLRFAGPETLETKIFGRLSAWQNWIFQRPNAVGATGALTLYGHPERPSFDWQRT